MTTPRGSSFSGQFTPFVIIPLSIIIALFNIAYQALRTSMRSKYLYYSLVILVALLLSIGLSVGEAGREAFQSWYVFILGVRGARPAKDPKVVFVEFNKWPGKEHVIPLLSLLDSYRPKLIAIPVGGSPILDSSIVQTVRNARLVIGWYTDDSAWVHYWHARFPNVVFGVSPWRENVYYTPRHESMKNFGVAAANAYSDLSKEIPKMSTDQELVNYYYRLDAYYSNFRRFHFQMPLEKSDTWEITSYGWEFEYSSFKFREKDGQITPDPAYSRVSPRVALADLSGRIVIPDFSGEMDMIGIGSRAISSADYNAAIIQNILDHDFLKVPSKFVLCFALLIWVGCVAFLYFRSKVWHATSAVLFSFVVLAAMSVLLYVEIEVLVSFLPFVIATVICMVFLVPFELTSERRLMLQEQARLGAELRAAHDMQMGLMPKEDPVVKGFDISGICIPANEVGGDFFDYVWLDKKKTKLGIALADVSGKAMKAAMTAVMTSGMLYSEAQKSQSPREILARINQPLYVRSDKRIFTVLSFAVIDTKTKKLTYSSAGQAHPILIRNKALSYLKTKGVRLPLGVKEELRYSELAIHLKRGDTLLFYTDGVPEAMNAAGELYGFERFEQLLKPGNTLSAQRSRDKIVADVKSFTSNIEQHDDMTVVVVKVV